VAHRDAQKYHLTRDQVQLQNRLESLLEETHIKLSSLVSDLLGLSARRMLQALADGETNPTSWPLPGYFACSALLLKYAERQFLKVARASNG
jgi:hypothetical protein